MGFEHIGVERSGDFATVTMNRPQRRNALSLEHMRELITAFGELGNSDVLGIVLAGNGPVIGFVRAADGVPNGAPGRQRLADTQGRLRVRAVPIGCNAGLGARHRSAAAAYASVGKGS